MRRGYRALRAAVAALVVPLTLVGCTSQGRIREAYGSPESSTLDLGVDTCNADHGVVVAESAEQVTVTITVRNDTQDDCADNLRVELDEPLGDRRLIDGTTGDEVFVQGGG